MTRRLRLAIGQHSRAGGERNQDFHAATLAHAPSCATHGIVVALADGIGSSAISHEASAAAVTGFVQDYACTSDAWPVRRAAQRVLQATNSWLHAHNQRSAARFERDRGLVCTFSALVFKGRQVHLLHVGDSRIYRVHGGGAGRAADGALEQLTEDHLLHLSSAEHYLARALGAAPTVEIDYQHWPAEVGDCYLLATDGAYERLDGAAVHAALAAHGDDLDAAARTLVMLAQARGSVDDATVQLVRIESLPEPDAVHLAAEREALTLPPPLAPRTVFEGHTIVRQLHASARSHVYLAVDNATGEAVVIKTPAVDLRQQPAALDRFLLEEWVARRLDSPHVLKPRAADRPRQHLFVAMEHVDGQTLAQWMVDHPRPELDRVRRIVEQIGRGLQAFHHKAMLHQDLRPENVMIDAHGTVKIIDFGSVHVAGLAEHDGPAQAGALQGSLQYTAPEYFTGAGGSERSDLFALAVLTYQLLTGQLPYGLQAARVRTPRDAQRLRYLPLRQHRADLPAWLDSVLRQALHPQPAKRHDSVSAFVHELHHPPTRTQRASPPLIERHPLVFWQAVSLLLGLAVLALLALRAAGR